MLILTARPDQPLTPAQRKFNQLIRKIDAARAELQAWQTQMPLFVQGHAAQVRPLLAEMRACQRRLVDKLDALLSQGKLSKTERQTARGVLCDLVGGLLDSDSLDEAERLPLKALYNKHAEVDFDTDNRESLDAMKDMFQAMTGVDLGDETFESEEAMLQRARERVQAEQEAAAQAPPPPEPARKTAAQRRRDAQAQEASQSVREVYRKLASALHPDRATDEADRATRTALMKRVNQAYDAKDLLALFSLQLEIEQVDAEHLARATAERAKHYNQVLSAQLAQLEGEVKSCEMAFVMEFGAALGLDPFLPVPAKRLGKLLEREVVEMRALLAEARRDLARLDEPKAVKTWLKQMRQQQREVDDDDLFF